jgi:hypothetical protein
MAGRRPDDLDPHEWEHLAETVTVRFGPHLERAAAAVRAAEHELAEARNALAQARAAAANQEYRSDRLVFMRATLDEELAGLSRKTTPKNLRAGFRHLLARAVELAEGEVAGYHADVAAERRRREHGVEALEESERQAVAQLDAARDMQARAQRAEAIAREGLTVLTARLTERPAEQLTERFAGPPASAPAPPA